MSASLWNPPVGYAPLSSTWSGSPSVRSTCADCARSVARNRKPDGRPPRSRKLCDWRERETAVRQRFAYVGVGHTEHTGLFWTEVETAFKNRVLTGAVINRDHVDPRQFLEDAGDTVLERIRGSLVGLNGVKVNTAFNAEFVAGDRIAVKTIATRNYGLLPASELREWYDNRVTATTLAALDEFQERDSGWALSRIFNLTINMNKYNPMRAGCQIKIPRAIIMKRVLINVRTMDNACFAWAVVAALYPNDKHVTRTSRYPAYRTVLDLTGIEFPMTLNQIGKFERKNGISINVFVEDAKKEGDRLNIVPLRLTDQKSDRHVNLLYVSDTRDGYPGHFAWIKNLSHLVSVQLSGNKKRKYICDRCLHYFPTAKRLTTHTVDCAYVNDCAIVLPSEDDKLLSFQNYKQKERAPFVVYADLECTLEMNGGEGEEEEDAANIDAYQRHRPFSV